jgi:hypothetical protein
MKKQEKYKEGKKYSHTMDMSEHIIDFKKLNELTKKELKKNQTASNFVSNLPYFLETPAPNSSSNLWLKNQDGFFDTIVKLDGDELNLSEYFPNHDVEETTTHGYWTHRKLKMKLSNTLSKTINYLAYTKPPNKPDIPEQATFVSFVIDVQKFHSKDHKNKIVVTCQAEKTGLLALYVILDAMIEEIHETCFFDLYGFIEKTIKFQPLVLKNFEQYKFLVQSASWYHSYKFPPPPPPPPSTELPKQK